MSRPKTIETSRIITDIWSQTPSPPPDFTANRAVTPEPIAGSSGGHVHWVLTTHVQHILQQKTVAFFIKHTSGDGALEPYEGCVARSVPSEQRDSNPRDGEIIVSVTKKNRQKKLSVNPKYLVPLRPIIGGEVIVVSGVLLGAVGMAKAEQGKHWVVTFTMDGESVDQTIEEKDLAPLE